MSAHVQCDDAILQGEFMQLILPLHGLSPKAVNENKSPLGALGGNINSRETHKRIGRDSYFVTVKVEVYVHVGSLQELCGIVNFIEVKLKL